MPCIDSCSMPCCARQWICCKCPMHMHSFSLRMTLSSSACFRACFCLLASVLASCAAACAMPGHAAACGAQRSAMRCRMQHAQCMASAAAALPRDHRQTPSSCQPHHCRFCTMPSYAPLPAPGIPPLYIALSAAAFSGGTGAPPWLVSIIWPFTSRFLPNGFLEN